MSATSFDRLLRSSPIASGVMGRDDFGANHAIRYMRPDRDQLEGKVEGAGARSAGGGAPGGGLSRRMAKRTPKGGGGARVNTHAGAAHMAFDARQRAIVKVHYFNHAGGGGAALKAHARYVARDAATRDDLSANIQGEGQGEARDEERRAKAHADYLSREGGAAPLVFYDGADDGVNGAARAEAWARSDRRHFRVVLSAENGARLHDMPAYAREVMARAEAALGTKLQWIAVDHHDTDNPHTHLIIRGRRANGQDLILPRDFIRYGFHSIARDVASEWLGPRTPADERLALEREVIRHGPTRLDRMIEAHLPEDRTVRIARLEAPNGDPSTTRAMKARARELARMGLAHETTRNVLVFEPAWRERLKAMELHLDIRKRIVMERTQTKAREFSLHKSGRGLLGR